jgi:hypothetical protein
MGLFPNAQQLAAAAKPLITEQRVALTNDIRALIVDLASRPLRIKGTIAGVQVDAEIQLGDKQ